MGLWRTRHHSMEMLAKDYKEQAKAIEEAFEAIDECISLFDKQAHEDNYYLICGLVLAKARNLGLGMYGLMLDGLGQEAGALMRPFIEYHELLKYFRLDPSRIEEAMNEKLPSAGKRAQLIEGYFKEFRDHLNQHASHSSFSDFSLNHLIDKSDMVIRKEQPMLPKVLFKNIGDFFVQMILLAIEAIQCLDQHKHIELAKKIEKLRTDGFMLFKLDERPEINV